MDIQLTDRHDGITHIKLIGSFDVAAAADQSTPLHAHIAARHQSAIIDLSDLSFISSLGLGTLTAIVSSLRRRGKKAVILNAQPNIAEAFHHTGIDQLIPLTFSEVDALAALAA